MKQARVAQFGVVMALGLGVVACGREGTGHPAPETEAPGAADPVVRNAVRDAAEDATAEDAAPAPSAFDELVLRLVNAHRAERGLRPLSPLREAMRQAVFHSQGVAEGRVPFGHAGFRERIDAISTETALRGAAENLALTACAPEQGPRLALQMWLQSSGHRENIEGDYGATGVGSAEDADGRCVVTQIFIRL